MQRNAIKSVGDVIKAHTTEKTLDELRAQGKQRVRVVSGKRVMEIIQAIVDDTIDSEVGEISTRDRNRIVKDTRERFDRVLKMQTDLESKVSNLRGSLRESDLERERLKADKGHLEKQLTETRTGQVEPEALMRVGRDVARLRESVDDIHRRTATSDDAAIGRAVDRLIQRDDVNAKRLATELDDVRQRLDGIGRETSRVSEKLMEALLQRVSDERKAADTRLSERLEREFGVVQERIDDLRERAAKSSAGADEISALHSEFDRLESRMRGVETSSANLVAEISETVFAKLAERDGVLSAAQSSTASAHADALELLEKRIASRLSEETAELVRAVETLGGKVAAIDDRTGNAVEAVAERVAERVVIDEGALTDAVARVASRVDSRIDEIKDAVTESDERVSGELKALRDDMHVAAADRTALDAALAHAGEQADERLDRAVATLRDEAASRHDALAASMNEGVARLDGQVAALAERSTAADESLAAAMSDGFGPALETALQTALGTALDNALSTSMDGIRAEIESLRVSAAESRAAAPEAIGEMLETSLAGVRREIAEISTRAAAAEASLSATLTATLDGAVTGMRSELEALAQHQATRAERQDEALAALRLDIAAQSESAGKGFEGALDNALDKIERTMKAATASPIDITVEATDVLLDKIFDAGDDELSTNLDQLEVEQSTSRKGIRGSLGKLRALHGRKQPAKTGTQ